MRSPVPLLVLLPACLPACLSASRPTGVPAPDGAAEGQGGDGLREATLAQVCVAGRDPAAARGAQRAAQRDHGDGEVQPGRNRPIWAKIC